MNFDPPLISATLLKRYKRFLADVRLHNGELITAHCPNTGSMLNCADPNQPCWLSLSDNVKRKYPYTLEITTATHGGLAGINTHRANALVEEALTAGVITELNGFDKLQREVTYGQEKSRVDFLLQYADKQCYLEVKNVTLSMENQIAMFPDAVTSRGTKHLRELVSMIEQGNRAVLLYCVQLSSVNSMTVANHIDPQYADTLYWAQQQGLEVLAYQAEMSNTEIVLNKAINVSMNANA